MCTNSTFIYIYLHNLTKLLNFATKIIKALTFDKQMSIFQDVFYISNFNYIIH